MNEIVVGMGEACGTFFLKERKLVALQPILPIMCRSSDYQAAW